jgi:hypothetical protein
MSQTTGIVITPLRPEQSADFLRFFDHERGVAFADNPQWAKCYCHYNDEHTLPRSDAAASRALLRGALESLAARGFKLVEAFPFKSGDSELAADHYHGPRQIFLDAGFSVLSEHKDLTVVRKLL